MTTLDAASFTGRTDETSVAFGSARYLQVATTNFPTSSFTLEFKVQTTAPGTVFFYGEVDTGAVPPWRETPMSVSIRATGVTLSFLEGAATFASSVLLDGREHDVAVTFSQPTPSTTAIGIGVYVDGALVEQRTQQLVNGQATSRALLSAGNLYLLSEPPEVDKLMSVSALFPGRVRHLRVWSSVLDAAAIQANTKATIIGTEPNLYLALPLNSVHYDFHHQQAMDLTPAQRHARAIRIDMDAPCFGALPNFNAFPVGDRTLSMWLRCGLDAANTSLFSYGQDAVWSVGFSDAATLNVAGKSVSVTLTDGRWHHLAVVVDGDLDWVYVDGTQRYGGPRSDTRPVTGGPLRLGNDVSGHLFNGQMRDVRVWSGARRPEQVKIDASGAPPADDSTLVAHWQLARDAGPDLSGHHNDLQFASARYLSEGVRQTPVPPPAEPSPVPGLIAVTSELTQHYRVSTAFSASTDLSASMGQGVAAQVFSIDLAGHIRVITAGASTQPGSASATDVDLAFPGTATCLASTRIGSANGAPTPAVLYAAGADNIVRVWSKHGDVVTAWQALPPIPMALSTDTFLVRGLKVGYGKQGEPFVVALCHILQKDSQQSQFAFFLLHSGAWARFDGQMQAIVDWTPKSIRLPEALAGGEPTAEGIFVNGTLPDGRQGVVAWAQRIPSARFAPFMAGEYSALAGGDGGQGSAQVPGVFVISRHEAGIYWIGEQEWQPDATTALQKRLTWADQGSGLQGLVPPALALVAVGSAAPDRMTLFALRADHSIYMLHASGSNPWENSWYPSMTFPGPFVRLCDAQENGPAWDAGTQLVAVTQDHGLRRIRFDPRGATVVEDLVIAAQQQVEEVQAYKLHVTLFSAGDTPAPGMPVKVFCDSETHLEINGHVRALDHDVPWEGFSGPDGKLVIALPTHTLGAAGLSLWAGFMPAADRIELSPAGSVQTRLSTLSVDDLLNAKATGADGVLYNVIAQTANIERAAVQAVIDGLNHLMGVSLSRRATNSPGAPAVFHRLNDPNVATYQLAGTTRRFPRLDPALADSFQLDFSTGTPVFTRLTQGTRAEPPRPSAWTLGDLLSAISDAGAVLENVVVNVANESWAEVRFVLNRVSYYLNHKIELVEEVFHLAHALWQKVGTEAEHIFRWLGHVFVWGDIQRSQRVLEHVFAETLAFANALPATIRQRANDGLTQLQQSFDAKFESFVTRTLGQQTTVGEFRHRAGTPPLASEVKAHRSVALSPFHHGAAHHAHGAALAARVTELGGFDAPVPPAIKALLDKLHTGSTRFQSDAAFTQGKTLIDGLLSNPQDLAHYVLDELLKVVQDVIHFGFTLAHESIDLLYNAVEVAINVIKGLLTTPIYIPFVSALYKHATGSDMTLMGLVSMSVAVPATILYKTLDPAGAAPFPTDASVTAAIQGFTYHTILQRSGFEAIRPGSRNEALQGFHKFCAASNSALAIVFTVFDPLLDAVPPDGIPIRASNGREFHLGGRPLEIMSMAALVMGGLGSALTCPWLDGKTIAPGIGSADAIDRMNWCIGWGSLFIDIGFAVSTRDPNLPGQARAARNSGDAGAWIACLWGALSMGLHTYWVVEDHAQDIGGMFEGYFGNVPVLMKCLRYSKWVIASEGESLLALVAFDIFGDFVAATLSVAGTHELFNPPPESPAEPPPQRRESMGVPAVA